MDFAKHTIKTFNAEFPDDNACLRYMFKARYSKLKICPKCAKKTKFHLRHGRKNFVCQYCGYQISPLADTIFHKSETSLKSWFYAIFLFSISKNGVSGKELQRQLGVTYKTAWRMAKQIRSLFQQDKSPLENEVEIDETYWGGRAHGKRGRGAANKTAIIGAVQRQGGVKARVMPDLKSNRVMLFIRDNVDIKASINTDELKVYRPLQDWGYKHSRILHKKEQYVKGSTYTNTIEGFWSQLKRSIHGTYHAVSPKYLQSYVDEFAYRYNRRHLDGAAFSLMLGEVARHAEEARGIGI